MSTTRPGDGVGAKVPEHMSDAHVMDFTILNCGHPIVSKHEFVIGDLPVYVHGLDEIQGSKLPVAVVFIAHGWANQAKAMEPMASGLIGEIHRMEAASGKPRMRDVLVVTMDQRNHGERVRVKVTNFDIEPTRLITMATIVTGGKVDHQYVMDFLPAILFPDGEREIVEFMSVGISMGGHVTWWLLREDPRIKIGVPMITLPSEALGGLLTARVGKLKAQGINTYMPESIKQGFYNPTTQQYKGKKIMSVHGKLDKLIPLRFAQPKLDEILAQDPSGKDIQQYSQEGKGHAVSPEMVSKAAEWLYIHGFWG